MIAERSQHPKPNGTLNTQGAPVMTTLVNHVENPKKFSGLHFKSWQKIMLFYLTTLNLARFLTGESLMMPRGEGYVQALSAIEGRKHSDLLCRKYVLNGLIYSLYNVHFVTNTAKDLWDSFEKNKKLKMPGPRSLWLPDFYTIKWSMGKLLCPKSKNYKYSYMICMTRVWGLMIFFLLLP